MASATATLIANAHPYGKDETQRREIIYGICTLLGGGTYVANGVPLVWQFQNASGARELILSTAAQPSVAYFFSQLGGGYTYVYDQTHDTLRIFNGGAELAGGAAIAADTIGFEAQFLRGY